ncbi:hypothetical protein KIH74_15155 [Kineosporia sp. J2-2]|uniref:PH domain-containing protein n=1 Tax=Kineosporia corallincola TaxID=2835133 RepID=A0ABS5TJN4_9ACTN|nr:hypothetical protein [Kineosporia corallincola]MBT0770278.1 hypothetical protein [Kineosporia corallincola]
MVSLSLTVDDVQHGGILKATTSVAATAYFALILTMIVQGMGRARPTRRPPRPAANDIGEPGIAFFLPWRGFIVLLLVMGSTAIVLVRYGVRFASSGTTGGVAIAAVSCAAAGFLVWFTAHLAQRGRGRLVLTLSGVYYRIGGNDLYAPWESITDVRVWNGPVPSFVVDIKPSPLLRGHNSLGRWGHDVMKHPVMALQANVWHEQTVPAYRATCYYFENPDMRNELAMEEQGRGDEHP